MPILTLPRLILSLISLAILAGGAYLLWSYFHGYDLRDVDGVLRHVNGDKWRLYAGLGMLAWSFLGRFVVLLFMRKGRYEPSEHRTEPETVKAPDGTDLRVETLGPVDGPTLVLTHGWGLNSTAWDQLKHDLGGRYRLVVWDLPGMGLSKRPPDGKFALDRFAAGLGAVVESATTGPVVLVGHSIGGMTSQTFFRAVPDAVKDRVKGVVLVDTTYENPLHTMLLSGLWTAIQKPIIEPACWLSVLLSPILWLQNWQGYLSGSNQLAMRLTGFGRYATRGQVDFVARLSCKSAPGDQAKGNLAMFHWGVRDLLPKIPVPVLVLAGTRDIVTLPRGNEVIAAETPKGRIIHFEGCNHMGFMERSDDYNRAISQFADEVLPARA
jgi:pimeloyl-ACP methyl ester carboxylesterase